MNKKLALLAGVAILIAIVVVVWARRGRSPGHAKSTTDTKSVHATSFDETDTSVSLMTMLGAPEGATPCETGFNALEAEQKAMKLRGGKSMFKWVAPKDEFLAQCKALPEKSQQCLSPRYRREHDDCTLARPPDAVLHKMFIPEPVVEEKIPGEE
jgi:hypothetical protein